VRAFTSAIFTNSISGSYVLKRPIFRCLILAAVCSLAIAPFFGWGTPSGHDVEFHIYSWMEVLSQWRQGILYPAWAAFAHWGYGEPRFLFYPPASWMLGAALGSILPWKIVPGVYCWLSLTAAGAAMYGLAKSWLPPWDAMFAASFYALNPYHLLIIYWRSAYAELLCAALLPLLLLLVLRLDEPSSRPALWLSLVLAGSWLANVPAALMVHYSAAALALVMALSKKSWRPLRRLSWAAMLGAGLAAIYLFPAIFEQRWINVAEVFSPGVRPQNNFLFTTSADVDHNHFNLLISSVAVSEIIVLICAVFASWRDRKTATSWKLLAMWGAASALVMFSCSRSLWEYLPKFRFVQLPFRWLLCLNVPIVVLLASTTRGSASRRWLARTATVICLLAVILIVGAHTQPPWWKTAGEFGDMTQSFEDGTGNEGVDEYVPAGADPSELQKDLPLLNLQPPYSSGIQETESLLNAQIINWSPTERHFKLSASRNEDVTVRLFNYPAWKATVNGRRVETLTSEVTGLMVVPLQAGENDVEIHFAKTRDRQIGDWISLISLLGFVAVWAKTRSTVTENTISRTTG
jgi:hypothetical protein